jgi:hypothetical protein
MKDRLKIPDGQRDASSRSMASNSEALIFVRAAMSAMQTC